MSSGIPFTGHYSEGLLHPSLLNDKPWAFSVQQGCPVGFGNNFLLYAYTCKALYGARRIMAAVRAKAMVQDMPITAMLQRCGQQAPPHQVSITEEN